MMVQVPAPGVPVEQLTAIVFKNSSAAAVMSCLAKVLS